MSRPEPLSTKATLSHFKEVASKHGAVKFEKDGILVRALDDRGMRIGQWVESLSLGDPDDPLGWPSYDFWDQ